MRHQFKPGDLAIIVMCKRDPSLIGCSVELVSHHAPGTEFEAAGRRFKLMKGGWLVVGDSVSHLLSGGSRIPGQVLIAEKCLMPLRGEGSPARLRAEELAHG